MRIFAFAADVIAQTHNCSLAAPFHNFCADLKVKLQPLLVRDVQNFLIWLLNRIVPILDWTGILSTCMI